MNSPPPPKTIWTFTAGPFRIGPNLRMDDAQIQQLVGIFRRGAGQAEGVLAGRTAVVREELKNVGAVAVKFYRRGGMVRHITSAHYLRIGKPRSRVEFDMLEQAADLGVSTLRPVAYAYRGIFFYRNWLVTHAVASPRTLVEVALNEPSTAADLMPLVTDQIRLLIRRRILHVDLHPGNVLIGGDGKVVLIDFDRAGVSGRSAAALAKRYVNRWQRAMDKYNLPNSLRLPPASTIVP